MIFDGFNAEERPMIETEVEHIRYDNEKSDEFSINTHVDSSTFRPLICESRCLFFSHLLAFYLPFSGVRTLQVVFAIWWRLVVGVTHLPPGRFGHYVRQALPEAMRVLDMQDFHALRLGTPAAFYVVLPFNRHMKTNDTHGLIMFVS